jgi:hypothetical protein
MGISVFSMLPMILFIVYGLFILLGIYVLYLLIKFLIRAIEALDIYLDEKKNKRF